VTFRTLSLSGGALETKSVSLILVYDLVRLRGNAVEFPYQQDCGGFQVAETSRFIQLLEVTRNLPSSRGLNVVFVGSNSRGLLTYLLTY
jgi:hypothetical protein